MTTTPEYDKLVEAKMHKLTQLSESEMAQEVAKTTEGVLVQELNIERMVPGPLTEIVDNLQPKKRGRPKGSRNKPKPSPA